MTSLNRIVLAAAALVTLGLIVGCGSPITPGTASTPQPAASEATTPATTPAVAEPANAANPEIEKGLAELSPEDQALARKQKVCPVSGEALGAMGKPYKIEVAGRTVFLCCSGCEDEIRKEPDKFLKKLDATKP